MVEKKAIMQWVRPGTNAKLIEETQKKADRLTSLPYVDLQHFTHITCPTCQGPVCWYNGTKEDYSKADCVQCNYNFWFLFRAIKQQDAQNAFVQSVIMIKGQQAS